VVRDDHDEMVFTSGGSSAPVSGPRACGWCATGGGPAGTCGWRA